MLTTAQILDMAMSMITDNTAEARSRMLTWLNTGMQDIARLRDWQFLHKTATLTLTNGQSDWPVDCAAPISFTVNNECIYPTDRMSDKDLADMRYGGEYGYRVATGQDGFTVYPAADSCVLRYKIRVPAYTDGTDATVWPIEMLDVFWRLCVVRFYEYDFDERTPGAGQLYERAIAQAKKWDNQQKPLPRNERRSIEWRNS